MRRKLFLAVYLGMSLLLATLAVAPSSAEQTPQADDVVRFRITNPGQALYKVAIPTVLGDAQSAAVMQEVLAGDLALSGFFKVLDPKSFVADLAKEDLGIGPDAWKTVGAESVIKGRVGTFGSDAHSLFGSRAGLPIWMPKVLAALDAAGLPTQLVHALPVAADLAAPPPSGFAATTDLDRVPLRSDRARAGYQAWLAAESPRAFAIHPTQGSWASAWGGERPIARALANCERFAKAPCRLYAVDDAVVWTTD